MSGLRAALVLVAALTLLGCGASSSGGGTPAAATPAAATQAPGGGGGGGGATLGTLNLTLGSEKHAYPILTCGDSGNTLGVIAHTGSLDKDGVAMAIPRDGSDPSISGVIAGNPWVIATDAKATLNGNSGTFSGVDAVSGKDVSGDFSCTN